MWESLSVFSLLHSANWMCKGTTIKNAMKFFSFSAFNNQGHARKPILLALIFAQHQMWCAERHQISMSNTAEVLTLESSTNRVIFNDKHIIFGYRTSKFKINCTELWFSLDVKRIRGCIRKQNEVEAYFDNWMHSKFRLDRFMGRWQSDQQFFFTNLALKCLRSLNVSTITCTSQL